jgi:hypothetical protein
MKKPSIDWKSRDRERQALSFLVRVWREPREADGEVVLRGYIRNLGSGEESYVTGPTAISEALARSLEAEERSEADRQPGAEERKRVRRA